MEIHILTIFPEMFTSPLDASILKRAQERHLIAVHVHNIRDFTTDRHRVTDATAIAQGRPSHEDASMYSRRMRYALAVAVDCYAGARGDETPRRFTRGEQLVEILAIVDQWRTPDHRYFTVRTVDETCTLRQDVTSGGWALTVLECYTPAVPFPGGCR